jgi:signal transduction histidine kinase
MSKVQASISALMRRLSDYATTHPYTTVGLMVAAVTAFGFAIVDVFRPSNIEALYLLVVFVTALKWGRRPALFAAFISTLALDFSFIPPRFNFAVTDLTFVVMLMVFLVVAITTSELASRSQDLMREKSARAQAEAAAAAKDTFLSKISHELRAPLTTILGWVNILQQNVNDAQRTARGLASLERNAHRLARLVNDLLDVSRIHVGKLLIHLQPLALAPVVTRAVDDAAIAAAEKGVTLQSGIESVGTVAGDKDRIEQIVTNLVSNAVKFTPPNGRVTVKLSETNGCARLVVADTGEGIPSEFISRVFEPFSQGQAQSSREGLGLGLAIVKHLVEGHHGRISVESAGKGRGTTFVVDFPLGVTARVGDSVETVALPAAQTRDKACRFVAKSRGVETLLESKNASAADSANAPK